MNLETGVKDLELSLSSKPYGGKDDFKGLLLLGNGQKHRGVILLHGRNAHPDGAVVGPLRRSLNALGYTTLSIQNPIPKAGDEFPNYVADIKADNYVFSEAYARIRSGMQELKKHGVAEVVLLGFSMGARMQAAYLAQKDTPVLPVRGLVAISGGTNGIPPLNIADSLGRVTVPLLDICGEADSDVASTGGERKTAYESGKGELLSQVVLRGPVPHNFAGHETALQDHVHRWTSITAPAN